MGLNNEIISDVLGGKLNFMLIGGFSHTAEFFSISSSTGLLYLIRLKKRYYSLLTCRGTKLLLSRSRICSNKAKDGYKV